MVFIEQHSGSIADVGYELVREGRKLAEDLGTELSGILIGNNLNDNFPEIFEYGIDRIYVIDNAVF